MKTFISPSRNNSSLLTHNKLHVAVQLDREVVHQLIAWSAVYSHGPTTVIDCGCAFNATRTLELIHLQHVHFRQAMDNIHVSRPFTAYQFKASTANLIKQQPSAGSPIVVMDALRLLYDDNIQLGEAMRLLKGLLQDLQFLRHRSPIILTIAPPPEDKQERICLLHAITHAANQIITPNDDPADSKQARQLTLHYG